MGYAFHGSGFGFAQSTGESPCETPVQLCGEGTVAAAGSGKIGPGTGRGIAPTQRVLVLLVRDWTFQIGSLVRTSIALTLCSASGLLAVGLGTSALALLDMDEILDLAYEMQLQLQGHPGIGDGTMRVVAIQSSELVADSTSMMDIQSICNAARLLGSMDKPPLN
ncbi:hypothetical protein N7476_004341 [Penicillium atrosanguineum]|uniref:Uncharacterized protein n=1 Tax=Penicillium atrosanguineum TaxID=1132637 RepID=A0A9W9U6X6_9EURO|nr:hypothetical protein N7526_002792 [Penicillium atrosanguineum]KAJ5321339.1 hypothetical protein N7476_004341 [Penicillium atrosanguineum]